MVFETYSDFVGCRERDAQWFTRRRILDRVVDEDQEQLSQESRVSAEGNITLQVALDPDLFAIGLRRGHRAGLFQHLLQVQRFGSEYQLARVRHRERE